LGNAGWGEALISGVHASPSKTGNNTEPVKICGSASMPVVLGTDPLTDGKSAEITVTPNPVRDNAVISFSMPEDTRATIDLYNSLGARVISIYNNTVHANELNSVTFNTEGLNEGIYLLVLRSGTVSKVVRIVLAK
jgi:hypothetical protein